MSSFFTWRVTSGELAETLKFFTAFKITLLVCRIICAHRENSYVEVNNSVCFEAKKFKHLVNCL